MRRRIWKSPPFPADFPMMVPPPSERASAEALENIHPFADDNGRTGRQILNMMLMQAGYEPIAIRHDAGSTYAGRLEQWQAYGDPVPLACMVADCVVREQCRSGRSCPISAAGIPSPDTPEVYVNSVFTHCSRIIP